MSAQKRKKTLLGSSCAKVASKMMEKLIPEDNFKNISRAAFVPIYSFDKKYKAKLQVEKSFKKICCTKKLLVKRW